MDTDREPIHHQSLGGELTFFAVDVIQKIDGVFHHTVADVTVVTETEEQDVFQVLETICDDLLNIFN